MEMLRALEARARERLPAPVYDYYAGGAGDEQTLSENAAAWRKVWIRPRVMVDVSSVDSSCTLLGERLALPVLLAPMALQRLLHPDGELAAARAAGAAGTVYSLSSRATTDLADVAAVASGPLWFQLYLADARERSAAILARAGEHGYRAVLLTVDVPLLGRRERERRHGEALRLPQDVALSSHLGYDLEEPANPLGGWDAAMSWQDVRWVHAASGGLPVVVKGVLTAHDARAAVDAGAAAIVVSNHGGRQQDGVVPTAVALREVAEAVGGEIPVLVDGGIRDGGDVLRALALGADAVMVGRPYAWGLATGGEAGVSAVLAALAADLRLAMALSGCTTLAEIDGERVRLAGW